MKPQKQCYACELYFPLDDFPRDASKADGHKSLCRPCDREKARAYYAANRERVLARANARNAEQRKGAT